MSLEEEYQRLKAQFEAESDPRGNAGVGLESFEEIVNLGEPVAPLLLQDLNDEMNWLSVHALGRLNFSDEPTFDNSQLGQLPVMSAAWITWGKQKGYLNEQT